MVALTSIGQKFGRQCFNKEPESLVLKCDLQHSAGVQASKQGSEAMSKADATERNLLAHMQSEVYKEIAASAATEARPLFGMRLPGLSQTADSQLRPGDFCLYEDVPGTELPSAQERRFAQTTASQAATHL